MSEKEKIEKEEISRKTEIKEDLPMSTTGAKPTYPRPEPPDKKLAAEGKKPSFPRPKEPDSPKTSIERAAVGSEPSNNRPSPPDEQSSQTQDKQVENQDTIDSQSTTSDDN